MNARKKVKPYYRGRLPPPSDITLASTTGKWVLASTILASSMAFIDSTAPQRYPPFLAARPQRAGKPTSSGFSTLTCSCSLPSFW